MLKFLSKILLAKKVWDLYKGHQNKNSHKNYKSYWD